MSKTFDLTTLNLSAGTYEITVKARASGYEDSPASDVVVWMVRQKLTAPRISIPEENILLIEQGDGNANAYSIRIDGTQKDTQNAPNDSTPLSYNLSKLGLSAGNYTATVVATAEGYIDSDSSNEQPIKVVESGKTHSGGSN